jgi:tetratricopeptide (TPR) repeat protein
MHWWVKLGYHDFSEGPDGYPAIGDVVRHYRDALKDERGRPMSQRELAKRMKVDRRTVQRTEKENEDLSRDRREALATILKIPPVLLGIVTLEEVERMLTGKHAESLVPTTPPSIKATNDDVDIEEYKDHLAQSWQANYKGAVYVAHTIGVMTRISTLYQELPHTMDKQIQFQSLLCEYHVYVANLWRDQQDYNGAIFHLNRAKRFADALENDELLALVYHRRALTLEESNRIDEAIADYAQIKKDMRIPALLKGAIVMHKGLVIGKGPRSRESIATTISLCDQGGNIIRSLRDTHDPYFLRPNMDRYYLNKAAALIAVGHNRDALDELGLVSYTQPRRNAYNSILQSQAYANLGNYAMATACAESGLEVVQRIGSQINIARVQAIYDQLQTTSFANHRDTQHLGHMLASGTR